MYRAQFIIALVLVALLVPACKPTQQKAIATLTPPPINGPKPKEWTKEILSPNYHLDKKYRSMKGPDSLQRLKLLDSPEPELLWITGFKAVMMDGKGEQPISQEFMCHSNLDFNATSYWENFGSDASMSGRLFTLSQGQQDVHFPEGHGIPIMSDETLDLATQVLNLNLPEPNIDVRHKISIKFIRDRDVIRPMVPMYQAAVQGFKSLEGKRAHYGVSQDDGGDDHGEGCSVGLPAMKGDVDKDELGQKFTGHWIVKPGREENRSLVTKFLQLQFDSKIHYIAVHLHPFAESLELIDLTTGKSVFKSKTKQTEGKAGLAEVEYYTSTVGLPIYKDHDYEIVSVYNNTSGEEQDSMAVMFLYLHDVNFKKPTAKTLAARKKRKQEAAKKAKKDQPQRKAKSGM
jgi:hypothetical protein